MQPPILHEPNNPLKELLKMGIEWFCKFADQDDEELARTHQAELASIISNCLLKIIISDTPVDQEVRQAVNVILGFKHIVDTTTNEWIDILKEALLRIETQYYSDKSGYIIDIKILYLDEDQVGNSKPKAIKLQTTFSYDDLPQELRNNIFEAMNNNQTLSYELYVKE